MRDFRGTGSIGEFDSPDSAAVHQLEGRHGVVLMNDVGDFLQAGDEFIIPDGHHPDIAPTGARLIGICSLGGYDSCPPSRLGLHVGHLFFRNIPVPVVEIGLGRGVFDSVFRLDSANASGTENVRILLFARSHPLSSSFPIDKPSQR